MNQNEWGVIYPFRLSASRMRRGAAQMRRQGQVLDALALVRRAAEQDDTPAAWQALADELRLTGNWEVAAKVQARVLSREPHQPGAWIGMARCMLALDQTELATDCAYHQLHEDPWSSDGDAARALLAETEMMPDRKEPRRAQRLIQRGISAWQNGDRTLGERRIRRALHIVHEKERLLVTTAMLCMLEMDFEGALRYLPAALRIQPDDARTLTSLATLYQQQGKTRIARGFLQRAARCADSVMAEDGLLTAAWAQDAWQVTEEYLQTRMTRWPHRIALLTAKAIMRAEHEDDEGAAELWREILAINPDDRYASVRMAQVQQQERRLQVPGMLPRSERERQMVELRMAAESLSTAELLRPGSRARRLTDWMLEGNDLLHRQSAMEMLERRSGDMALQGYLKELICRPFLHSEVRQWALIRLAEMGCREEMLMLTGAQYNTVQCQPISERKQQQPWRMFLPMLLEETRRYQQSREIAEFSASLWRMMRPEDRLHAAGSGRFVWCKAMEILYLRMMGADAQAARVAVSTPLSARRISRVLRKLAGNIEDQLLTE